MENLKKAIELAEACFKTKVRKNGEPYVQHCHNVMHMLKDIGLDHEKLLVAAMLHDVREKNTIHTYDPEIKELFGDRVDFILNAFAVNKKPTEAWLKENFIKDGTHETFEAYVDHRFLVYSNIFSISVFGDLYILFIKLAAQIDNISIIEELSNQEMEREIEIIKKYFFPVYERMYSKSMLLHSYEDKYTLLKNRLIKIVAEKEALLKERLQTADCR